MAGQVEDVHHVFPNYLAAEHLRDRHGLDKGGRAAVLALYGQAVKFYEAEPIGPGRYCPPKVVDQQKTVITGRPDHAHISTSLVERQNLTMRMSMRRFTRLTNAFSKKVENLQAAVALHFAHYNFVRVHKSLRMTPAMAAQVSNRLWTLEELVDRTSN
jgi:hypothetical protein